MKTQILSFFVALCLLSTIGCKKEVYKVPQPHVWTELLSDSSYKYILTLDEEDVIENGWGLVYFQESTQQWSKSGSYSEIGTHVSEFYIYHPGRQDAYRLLVEWYSDKDSKYTMERVNSSGVKQIIKKHFWY